MMCINVKILNGVVLCVSDLDVVFVWMTEDHLEAVASVWNHADCALVKHHFIRLGLLYESQFVHM